MHVTSFLIMVIALLSVLPFQKDSRRHRQKQKHKGRTRHSDKSDGRYTGDLHQCLGPSCIEVARPNSKYCSEDCGMKLAAKWVLFQFLFVVLNYSLLKTLITSR